MSLFQSIGVLKYSTKQVDDRIVYKLIVEIDPDIAKYYRTLIPKHHRANGTRYAPHITVVRPFIEVPNKLDLWGKYQDEEVEFQYYSNLHVGTMYFWLDIYSKRLEEIRIELGLPPFREVLSKSGQWYRCFHCTIANCKDA